MGAGRFLMLLLCGVSAAAGCAHRVAATVKIPHDRTTSVSLNGHNLTLHLAPGLPHSHPEVLVYATGDAGWHRKDRDVFRQLQTWGYAVVGVSTPQYLKLLPDENGTTPGRLAADFATMIDSGVNALHLAENTPVVLVGVSRGADLAVVAAGQASLRPRLAGVVAIGLTREEEYVHRRRTRVAFPLYEYLPQLGDLPLTVIQSTRDNYLPADAARSLFGDDTPVRRFESIDARNHSFAGARSQLYATLKASLRWLDLARTHLAR